MPLFLYQKGFKPMTSQLWGEWAQHCVVDKKFWLWLWRLVCKHQKPREWWVLEIFLVHIFRWNVPGMRRALRLFCFIETRLTRDDATFYLLSTFFFDGKISPRYAIQSYQERQDDFTLSLSFLLSLSLSLSYTRTLSHSLLHMISLSLLYRIQPSTLCYYVYSSEKLKKNSRRNH